VTKSENKILKFIRENPGASVVTITETLDLHKVYVQRILKKMHDQGLVSRVDPPPPLYYFNHKDEQ
jgi:DNA-binding MarR family transcriptional regulator